MPQRLRDLGIRIGYLCPGPLNAITDVPNVGVAHTSVIADQPRVARTGITAITTTQDPYWDVGVFAGVHRFNGFGELLGAHWIEETGILSSPIFLTSTFSVGIVRDTILAHPYASGVFERFHQPVVAETNDGWLSDGLAQAINSKHVTATLAATSSGSVLEGNVGGGTGMVCFEFKGGIGTSSRQVEACGQSFTVGALVQANFGNRRDLIVAGTPVGSLIGSDVVPLANRTEEGSIVAVIATDAPLLPVQCKRLAQRAVVGLGRTGASGANRSGDMIIAFSNGNRVTPRSTETVASVSMLANSELNPLFQAVIEATEESILNALVTAETMTGRKGRVAHGLPGNLLQAVLTARR